jgi:hypothetical protein
MEALRHYFGTFTHATVFHGFVFGSVGIAEIVVEE